MNKTELAKQYNLSLEAVEWVVAMHDTLKPFATLEPNSQKELLLTICGFTDSPCSIDDLEHLWTSQKSLSDSQIEWLLKGLSHPEATSKLLVFLEKQRADFTAQDETYWASVQEDAPDVDSIEDASDIDGPNTGRDNDSQPISQEDQEIYQEELHSPIFEGDLLLRLYSPHEGCWRYYSLEEETTSIRTLNEESTLLKRVIANRKHPQRRLALLCLDWKQSTMESTQYTHDSTDSTGTLEKKFDGQPFHQQHQQIGALSCMGNTQTSKVIDGIDIGKRCIQSGIQRLSTATIQLQPLFGDGPPLYWQLKQQLNQAIEGLSQQGEHLRLRNSIFCQSVGDEAHWLAGTSKHPSVISLPHTASRHKDSGQQRWIGEGVASLQEHCSTIQQRGEPVFNKTPKVERHLSQTLSIVGRGHSLTHWLFTEQFMYAKQTDPSRRTQVRLSNTIEVDMQGRFQWGKHTLAFNQDGSITWTHKGTTKNIVWIAERGRQHTRHKNGATTTSVNIETGVWSWQ